MKKVLSFIAAAAIVCSFTGCIEAPASSAPESSSSAVEETEPVYEGPVDDEVTQPFRDYFNGFNFRDTEMTIKAITPQAYIDALKQAGKYQSLVDQNLGDIEATADYWKETFGENTIGSYEKEITNIPLTNEQLKCIKRCYEYTYYDVKADIEIEKGYEVKFSYFITGDKDTQNGEETACFFKVKGDGWKMLALPAEALEEYKTSEDAEVSQ